MNLTNEDLAVKASCLAESLASKDDKAIVKECSLRLLGTYHNAMRFFTFDGALKAFHAEQCDCNCSKCEWRFDSKAKVLNGYGTMFCFVKWLLNRPNEGTVATETSANELDKRIDRAINSMHIQLLLARQNDKSATSIDRLAVYFDHLEAILKGTDRENEQKTA